VGQNELVCSRAYEWDRNFQRCYHYVLFNNLVLAVPIMEHMSKSGTFSKCKVVLVLPFFAFLVLAKKKSWCCKITLLVIPKWDRCPKVGHSPKVIFSYSFAILVYVKSSPILQKSAGRDCQRTWKYWPAPGPVFNEVGGCFLNI